ncbi:MAG: pseudouridine synthase, partial [Selenomonadaceae bacterium]|nr:pseudouridine synthase [Selenomonadaceae bacterium]
MGEERLQKLISRAGLMSRREAENFITAGRVTVDGEVVNR